MLSLTRFTKKVASSLSVGDRALLKIYLIILGLLLAKIFPVLTSLHRGYFVIVLIICKSYFITKIRGQKK